MRLRRRGGINARGRTIKKAAGTGKLSAELGLMRSARVTVPAAERAGTQRKKLWLMSPRRQKTGAVPAMAATGLAVATAVPMRRSWQTNTRPFFVMAGAALLATVAIFWAVTLAQSPAQARGEQVYFDGRMLCVVSDREVAEQALGRIQEELRAAYGMEIEHNGTLSFVPVTCDNSNLLGAQETEQALRANIEARVLASVIMVNGRPAVALRTNAEARQALDDVLAPFQYAPADRSRTDVDFVETVMVEQMPIDYSLVQDRADAVRTLALGKGVQDNHYTVEKGDSLARIAKKFDLKVSDLRKANPEIASSSVIQPGQTLNAVKPANWVNVRYTETVTRQEPLPFETVEQPDATLYTTQKKTEQEGKNGLREVVAKITYINGVEAVKEIESEAVIEQAQNRIVLRGTKAVPKNAAATGGSTKAGKFMLPLNTYKISSRFGMRTLLGVTRLHAGVDLAAPTGTPIYASRSGTVTFSGSNSGYGLLVKIDHGNGIETRYGHCSKLLVKKGQKVDKGQLIALVGSTGRSTGPHCHFEVRINGDPIDPLK